MIQTICDYLGVSREDLSIILAALALFVTILFGLLNWVPPLKRASSRAWERILLLLGLTERVYARRFLERHGKLKNIY